jgi:hypothetical protein
MPAALPQQTKTSGKWSRRIPLRERGEERSSWVVAKWITWHGWTESPEERHTSIARTEMNKRIKERQWIGVGLPCVCSGNICPKAQGRRAVLGRLSTVCQLNKSWFRQKSTLTWINDHNDRMAR